MKVFYLQTVFFQKILLTAIGPLKHFSTTPDHHMLDLSTQQALPKSATL